MVYGVILLALFSLFNRHSDNREPLALDVIRDRNQLYRETREGLDRKRLYPEDHEHGQHYPALHPGRERDQRISLQTEQESIQAAAGEVISVPARVRADEFNLEARSSEIEFILSSADGDLSVSETARFLGPVH